MGVEPTKAEIELRQALDVLEQGREGASRAWVKAAEDYVARCREKVLKEPAELPPMDYPWRSDGPPERSMLH